MQHSPEAIKLLRDVKDGKQVNYDRAMVMKRRGLLAYEDGIRVEPYEDGNCGGFVLTDSGRDAIQMNAE